MSESDRRHDDVATQAEPARAPRAVLYPNHYVWYLFAASLDIMFTYAIIYRLGGVEVNKVAARLVERFEHWGLIALKFATVVVVVLVCEVVGRKRWATGRALAVLAIAINLFPVGYGIVQILAWMHWGGAAPENLEHIPLDGR